MSHHYVVEQASIEQVVRSDRSARLDLRLLPVLPGEALAALLRARLLAEGHRPTPDGGLERLRPDGVRLVFRPEDGVLDMSIDGDAAVWTGRRRILLGHPAEEPRQAALTAADEAADTRCVAAAEARRNAETHERLQAALQEERPALDRLLHRVTADALERRAAQLGMVTEVVRDDTADTLTVRVRVA